MLSRLEPGDINAVMDAVTRLDDVSAEEILECLKRLAEEAERWKQVDVEPSSELAEAKKQLDNALSVVPSKREKKLQTDQPFAFLTETIPPIRDHVLSDEHPKNIAIILSCMPPQTASECMKGLEPNLKVSVIKRLCELEEVREEEVIGLVYAMRMRLNKLLSSRAATKLGVQSAAEMLSCTDPTLRETLLTYVGQTDPDLAYKLQRSVFGIERLVGMPDEDIKLILKHVDTSNWAPAIKNASLDLIEVILNNLGENPRVLLAREIEESGLVSEEDEGVARKNIIQVVLELARDGKIELRKSGPRPVTSFFALQESDAPHKTFEITAN